MSTLLTILAIAFTISVLAKSGVITPFIAGGLGIAYSSITQASYEQLLLSTILFYFIAYFANTWAETDNRSMTTMINLSAGGSPLPLFTLKVAALIIFSLLPIPKPAFYLQGILAIIIAVTIYCRNSPYKTSDLLIGVTIQTVIFITLGLLFNRFSDHSSYSMALIAAVAIPNLLNPSTPGRQGYENEVDVSLFSIACTFFLTYITPGYSSSVITKSVYLQGKSQMVAGAILESAIEGWALHIALTNQITTKAVLGDLLSLPELEWSTFTPFTSLKLVMLCLPIIAAVIVVCTPMLNVSVPILVPCAILMLQATMTCGLLWSAAFILCGCINHNLSGFNDKSYTGLSFMTQL